MILNASVLCYVFSFAGKSLECFHAMPLRYGCYVWKRLINLELDPGNGISLQKTVIGEIHEAFVVLCCFFISGSNNSYLGHQTLVVALLLRRSTRQPRDPQGILGGWVVPSIFNSGETVLFQYLTRMECDSLFSKTIILMSFSFLTHFNVHFIHCLALKEIVHPKVKMLPSFTQRLD